MIGEGTINITKKHANIFFVLLTYQFINIKAAAPFDGRDTNNLLIVISLAARVRIHKK